MGLLRSFPRKGQQKLSFSLGQQLREWAHDEPKTLGFAQKFVWPGLDPLPGRGPDKAAKFHLFFQPAGPYELTLPNRDVRAAITHVERTVT